MAKKKSTSSSSLSLVFREDIHKMISSAEDELVRLGYNRDVWQQLLSDMDFNVGVFCIPFKSSPRTRKLFSEGNKHTDNDQEILRNLFGRCWAEAAALCHEVLNCKDPRIAFALGYSYSEKIAFLNQQLIGQRAAKGAFRKSLSAGGKGKTGKYGPFKIMIQHFIQQDKSIKFQSFINLLRREDPRIMDYLDNYHAIPAITGYEVDNFNQKIVYKVSIGKNKIVEEELSYGRIKNIFSELKKPKK